MQKTTPMLKVDERLLVPAHTWPIRKFNAVGKYKSVWRGMRRGTVAKNGEVLPLRPFNNSKRTKGRKIQKDFEAAKIQLDHILKKARRIDTKNAEKR